MIKLKFRSVRGDYRTISGYISERWIPMSLGCGMCKVVRVQRNTHVRGWTWFVITHGCVLCSGTGIEPIPPHEVGL